MCCTWRRCFPIGLRSLHPPLKALQAIKRRQQALQAWHGMLMTAPLQSCCKHQACFCASKEDCYNAGEGNMLVC